MPEGKVLACATTDGFPCVTLGAEEIDIDVVEVDCPTPSTVEERIALLEAEHKSIRLMFDSLYKMVKALRDHQRVDHDKQISEFVRRNRALRKIPIGTVLYGTSRDKSFFLEVVADGFMVGQTKCPSLSAAAQLVSGVRRSGLDFWKFSDGSSVKDMIKE